MVSSVRQDDDARRPAFAKGGEDPDPPGLDGEVGAGPDRVRRPVPRQPPEAGQPCGVQRHHDGVVAGRDLDGTPFDQPSRVAPRPEQFRPALQGDEGEEQEAGAHGLRSRTRQDIVKPGPIATRRQRSGRPHRITRSRTNSTVADDMLPCVASTARS